MNGRGGSGSRWTGTLTLSAPRDERPARNAAPPARSPVGRAPSCLLRPVFREVDRGCSGALLTTVSPPRPVPARRTIKRRKLRQSRILRRRRRQEAENQTSVSVGLLPVQQPGFDAFSRQAESPTRDISTVGPSPLQPAAPHLSLPMFPRFPPVQRTSGHQERHHLLPLSCFPLKRRRSHTQRQPSLRLGGLGGLAWWSIGKTETADRCGSVSQSVGRQS